MKSTLFYDEHCRFCRWSAARILAWDKRKELRPVGIFSTEGSALLGDLSEEEKISSWHLLYRGALYSGADAFAPLLKTLPLGKAAALLAELFPGFAERSYNFVSKRRGLLGKLVSDSSDRFAWQMIRSR